MSLRNHKHIISDWVRLLWNSKYFSIHKILLDRCMLAVQLSDDWSRKKLMKLDRDSELHDLYGQQLQGAERHLEMSLCSLSFSSPSAYLYYQCMLCSLKNALSSCFYHKYQFIIRTRKYQSYSSKDAVITYSKTHNKNIIFMLNTLIFFLSKFDKPIDD